ncbi:DUF2784 domain-containing protein [Fulvivirgaceae bacterium LMO-SS25]
MLQFLNIFFFVFHTALILFNLFGWLFTKTRKLHFYSILLMLFSWLILGFWKGFGYCFLTDWHYQILRKLGERDLPGSYISFLVKTLTGWLPDNLLVDLVTVSLTAVVLACSVYVNFIKQKKS